MVGTLMVTLVTAPGQEKVPGYLVDNTGRPDMWSIELYSCN